MTVPVIALIGLMAVPRQWQLRLYAAAAIGFAVVVLVAAYAPAGPLRLIDDEWLSIIRARSYYLFPTTWPIDGWGRTTVVLATLLLGATTGPSSSVAAVCRAALVVGVVGLLLAVRNRGLADQDPDPGPTLALALDRQRASLCSACRPLSRDVGGQARGSRLRRTAGCRMVDAGDVRRRYSACSASAFGLAGPG